VPADDNRARAVRAAALLIGDHDAAVWQSLGRLRQTPESSDIPEDVRVFVERNQESMRVAELALGRRQSSLEAEYGSARAGGSNTPSWLSMRRLSQALYSGARVQIKAERPDLAARRIATGLALSASLRQEPSLIAQLIRIGAATEHCDAVRRLLAQADLPADSLRQLAYWLQENREFAPMQVGLVAELRYGDGMFLSMERGDPSGVDGLTPFIWQRIGRVGRPFVRLARARYLREMEQLIDREISPRPHSPFRDLPRARRWSWRRMSDEMIPGLRRAVEAGDRFSGVLGVTELGVALRRYHVDHAEYPEDLSALVPAYLVRLPADPRTGRPPVYARVGAGFTLKADGTGQSSGDAALLEWRMEK
jgi:hypothetical protein